MISKAVYKKPRFSQHFLTSKSILHKIADSLEIDSQDIVVEVGAGHGELTQFLLKAKKVIAYEIDQRLMSYLEEKFFQEIRKGKLTIINADFLKADLSQYQHNYKLTGNIPFKITGKIFRKVFTLENHPRLLVFTLQKEVGQRLLGKPHNNFLSQFVRIFGEPQKIFLIKRKFFHPPPKVDALAVKIKFFQEPLIHNIEKFANFLKIVFQYPKRKLKHQKKIKVSEELKELLEKRPFQLTFSELFKLFSLNEK